MLASDREFYLSSGFDDCVDKAETNKVLAEKVRSWMAAVTARSEQSVL